MWETQVPSPSNEPISSFQTLLLFHLICTQRSREMKHCKKGKVNFVSENRASSALTALHLNGVSHSLHKQNYPTAVMTKTQKYRNDENGERQLHWQLSLNPPNTNEEAERNSDILMHHKVVTCKKHWLWRLLVFSTLHTFFLSSTPVKIQISNRYSNIIVIMSLWWVMVASELRWIYHMASQYPL